MRFTQLFRRTKCRAVKNRSSRKSRSLRIEGLEGRQLMAATVGLFGNELRITADPSCSAAEVREYTPTPCVPSPQGLLIVTTSGHNQAAPQTYVYPELAVGKIVFNGGVNGDRFENFAWTHWIPCVVNGNGGDDFLRGGMGADTIDGGAGFDTIYGGANNDTLIGGANNDALYGESGIDSLYAGAGTDKLWGGTENDTLCGDEGADYLNGQAGSDTLWGDVGNYTIDVGADILEGDAGDDWLYGMGGNDTLRGGIGNDTLYGGAGDDTFISIDNGIADKLFGDEGADSFWIDGLAIPGVGTLTDQVGDANYFERTYNTHAVTSFANGADKTLDGDRIADPTGGTYANGTPVGTLFYNRFNGRPLFADAGPSHLDIDQNDLGDCWMLATLGNAARTNPNSIRQTVADLGDGTYAVELGGNFYRVDDDLPTWSSTNTTLRFAGLGQQNSLWAPIVEKAYAFYRPSQTFSPTGTYGVLDGGWPSEVFTAIGNTGFVTKSFTKGQEALNHIASELKLGKAVTVNINNPSSGSNLVKKHTYMVERINYKAGTSTPESVVLRNPWGVTNALITLTADQLAASMYSNGNGIQSAFVC